MDYSVLGLHGSDVETVNLVEEVTNADGQTVQQVTERNVARVRMFIGDQMIDEDFYLPKLITVEEQIDTAVKARIEEIKAHGVKAPSNVVPVQTEQIVDNINE